MRFLFAAVLFLSFVNMSVSFMIVQSFSNIISSPKLSPTSFHSQTVWSFADRCCSVCNKPRLTYKSIHMSTSQYSSEDSSSFGDHSINKKNRRFHFPKMNITSSQVASLGASAALSYGAVSNLNMGICAMMAFATFGKSTGLSPLASGAMPKFAAVYAGYWIAMNFLRPARIAVAVTISPLFDRLMVFLQNKFRIPKPAAFGLVIFLVNVVGNLTFLISGLFMTSRIIGIPLLP